MSIFSRRFPTFLQAFGTCFCRSIEILTVESKTKRKYSFLLSYLFISCNVILVYVLIPIWNNQIKFYKKSIKRNLRRCKCLFAKCSREKCMVNISSGAVACEENVRIYRLYIIHISQNPDPR